MFTREIRPGVFRVQPETALEILMQARFLLTKKNWAQGDAVCAPDRYCAGSAIDMQGFLGPCVPNWDYEYGKALGFFISATYGDNDVTRRAAAMFGPFMGIVTWNDTPGRTYEEVDRAFATAIDSAIDEEIDDFSAEGL